MFTDQLIETAMTAEHYHKINRAILNKVNDDLRLGAEVTTIVRNVALTLPLDNDSLYYLDAQVIQPDKTSYSHLELRKTSGKTGETYPSWRIEQCVQRPGYTVTCWYRRPNHWHKTPLTFDLDGLLPPKVAVLPGDMGLMAHMEAFIRKIRQFTN